MSKKIKSSQDVSIILAPTIPPDPPAQFPPPRYPPLPSSPSHEPPSTPPSRPFPPLPRSKQAAL